MIFLFVCAITAHGEGENVYRKVTSQSDIVDGGTYVMVSLSNDILKYANGFSTSSFTKKEGANENNISDDKSEFTATDACEITLHDNGKSGYTITLNDGKHLCINSSNMQATQTIIDDKGIHVYDWTVNIDGEGYAQIKRQDGSNTIRYYNSTFTYVKSTTGSPIYLYRKVVEPEYVSVTVTDACYATLYCDKDLDFTSSSFVAYTAVVNGDHLDLTEVKIVPKDNAVILYSESGAKTEDIPVAQVPQGYVFPANNVLRGTHETVYTDDVNYEYYVLANRNNYVAFYTLEDNSTLPINKAYIQLAKGSNQSKISLVFNNTPTALSTVSSTTNDEKEYNLSGQQVSKSYRGIIIRNGKKVIK